MRLIVGLTGASGVMYGVRLLEILQSVPDVETHLIVSPSARQTLRHETNYDVAQVAKLACVTHRYRDIAAAPSSGSFRTDGMIVCPCSIGTLSGIAHSSNDNLLVRAADVTLKEQRRLVLVPRETPLHVGHLRLLAQAAENGAVMAPPMPAFYSRPQSLGEVLDHTVYRLLDLFGVQVEHETIRRWPQGDSSPEVE